MALVGVHSEVMSISHLDKQVEIDVCKFHTNL